jgi:membrane associated rhomboid family serine protease
LELARDDLPYDLAAMLPLWDANPNRRAPVMTVLIITANLAVFVGEVWLMLTKQMDPFIRHYALVPRQLFTHWADGAQWLTLFTHMFLHGGVAHVLGNCWFLWIFGKNVEDRLGPLQFLIFYLLSGLAAAALQVIVDPGSSVPMLGASGAISGVLGAYLLLFPTAWIITLVPWIVPILPVPAFISSCCGLSSRRSTVSGRRWRAVQAVAWRGGPMRAGFWRAWACCRWRSMLAWCAGGEKIAMLRSSGNSAGRRPVCGNRRESTESNG